MTDQETAQAWAKQNPTDPRAAKILSYFGAPKTSTVANPGLGTPAPAIQGGPQDPETGLDQGQLAATNTPGNAAAGGVVLGGLLGGVSGAIPGAGAIAGGALTNMLTGYLGRSGQGQKTGAGNVAMDAFTGAALPAALKGVGSAARAMGAPKIAGAGLGVSTQEAAASAGPSLNRVPDQAMKFLMRQKDPAGATKLAGMFGKQGTEAAEASMAAGGIPPSRMIDAAAQTERFAQPASMKSMIRGYMGGMINSPAHASFGIGPSANMAEQSRFLSMMAQGAERGLPLTPEMEAALRAVPGQAAAPSAVGAASGAYGAKR